MLSSLPPARDLLGIAGLCFLPSYLVGSIPFGYLFGRLKGVDIRQHGSGNIGATNVWRVLGKGWGITAFLLDFLKASMAFFVVSRLVDPPPPETMTWVLITIFLGAVIGHNYPVWLKFQGGKGIATTAGGLLRMMPLVFVTVLLVWIVVFAVSRIVSLASLCAALALPVAAWFFLRGDPVMLGFTILLAALAFWRHRANIGRLLNGTEHRWGRKSDGVPSSNRESGSKVIDV